MWKEFREFAVKGNVMDMAVGLIIGAAFGTIVTKLVEGLLMPPIGLALGGLDVTDLFVLLKEGVPAAPYASLADAQAAGAVVLAWGDFLNAVISFLIVAFSVFLVVKAVNRARRAGQEEAAEAPAEPEMTTDQQLLTEIRDLLRARPAA